MRNIRAQRASRMMLSAWVVLLFLGGALSFLPGGEAQNQFPATIQVSFKNTDNLGQIQPLGKPETAEIDVTVTYNPSTISVGTIPVKLTVTATADWINAVVSPETLSIPVTQSGPTTTEKATATLYVSASADAPYGKAESVKVTASFAQQSGTVQGPASDASAQVAAKFYSLLDVRVDNPIQIGRPQETVLYPITIRNLGNGQAKVSFDFVDKSVPEGWNVALPSSVTLLERMKGAGSQGTVNLAVQTPFYNGYVNKVSTINIRVSAVNAVNPSEKGDTSQFSLITTAKGFYVPGIPALALVGVLGVAAGLKRRFLG